MKNVKGSSTNTTHRLSEYGDKSDSWILNQIEKDFVDSSFSVVKNDGVTEIEDDEIGSKINLIAKKKIAIRLLKLAKALL